MLFEIVLRPLLGLRVESVLLELLLEAVKGLWLLLLRSSLGLLIVVLRPILLLLRLLVARWRSDDGGSDALPIKTRQFIKEGALGTGRR